MIRLPTDVWTRSLSLTEVSNNFIIIHSKYSAVSNWLQYSGLFFITSCRLPNLEDVSNNYTIDLIGSCLITYL